MTQLEAISSRPVTWEKIPGGTQTEWTLHRTSLLLQLGFIACTSSLKTKGQSTVLIWAYPKDEIFQLWQFQNKLGFSKDFFLSCLELYGWNVTVCLRRRFQDDGLVGTLGITLTCRVSGVHNHCRCGFEPVKVLPLFCTSLLAFVTHCNTALLEVNSYASLRWI